MREAGRSGTVSGETRCYSCDRNGHLARNCPTPGQRVCYVCYQPGHEARDCKNRKREGERRDEVAEKRPKRNKVMQYLSWTKYYELIYEAELERLVAHSDVRMLNSKTLLQRVVCN